MQRIVAVILFIFLSIPVFGSPIILRYRGDNLIFTGADVVKPIFRRPFMFAELTIDQPLAPLLSNAAVLPNTWVVNNGFSYDHSVFCVACADFRFSTDAWGNITGWNFHISDMLWPDGEAEGSFLANSSSVTGDFGQASNFIATDTASVATPGAWTAADLPEPPSIWLVAIGIIAIGGLKLRSEKKGKKHELCLGSGFRSCSIARGEGS